jgi:hypothetical protein
VHPAVRPLGEETFVAWTRNFTVLVADESDCSLGPMALRLTRIGIDPLYANDQDEALLLAEQEKRMIGAVCFPSTLDPAGIDSLVKKVTERAGLRAASMIPVGERPDDEALLAMRELGICWALWGESTDEDLRFVLAHVIEQHNPDDLRFEPRVPADFVAAKLCKGTLELQARVVDLAVTGAFLQTDRPRADRTAGTLELELPSGTCRQRATVRWTRDEVDSSDPRELHVGMGVQFEVLDIDAEDLEAPDPEEMNELRAFVRTRLTRYVVSAPRS